MKELIVIYRRKNSREKVTTMTVKEILDIFDSSKFKTIFERFSVYAYTEEFGPAVLENIYELEV